MAKVKYTAKAFRRALNRWAKTVPEKIALEAHAKVAEVVFHKVLMTTPVLTGRARRNWNISYNQPNPETTEEVAGVAVTGAPVTAEERARAREILRNILFGRIGTKIYIANFLPYIYFLERGDSKKAPQGITQLSIMAALDELKKSGSKTKIKVISP